MKINNKYVCICDRKKPELAAVIVSYLSEKDSYLPVFEFPFVSIAKRERDPDLMDEHTMSAHRAEEMAILINNAIARMGDCENVILAGLSEDQRSYLRDWEKLNQVSIDSIDEADFLLSPHSNKDASNLMICKSSQLLQGLFIALAKNALLQFDQGAADIVLEYYNNENLIVTEDDTSVSGLSAVLYAYGSGSDLKVVAPLLKKDRDHVFESIQSWREGNDYAYMFLEEQVMDRMSDIEIGKYTCATFFSTALPYSLILKNVIPFSYVHLHAWPDLFVLNSLLYDQNNTFGGAVVFSPIFFEDEETDLVIKILEKSGYYVKLLIAEGASVQNLRMNLKEFPYDLFHICSHGGEVKGDRIGLSFKDDTGVEHKVEYESVVSFSAAPKPGLIAVQEKVFPKVFDGLRWASTELKAKGIPQKVFGQMHQVIRTAPAKDKVIVQKDIVVTNSTSIHCSDALFQALMQTVASHTSPVIFNNSCWSWYHIAEPFLTGGARGYIGCLWAVGNDEAVTFAKTFYNSVFKETVLSAFHAAIQSINDTISENIYVYWGLPFISLKPTEVKKAKQNILEQLLDSYFRYETNHAQSPNDKVREGVEEILNWIEHQIESRFKVEFIEDLKRKKKIMDEEHPGWDEKYRRENRD